MIFVTADHGGFELKNFIIGHLKRRGLEISDEGPHSYDVNDDYPNLVIPVVEKVLQSKDNKAIMVCRNGVGVSMTANKFRGIRAAVSWNTDHAKTSRLDDDTNVLALPADHISQVEATGIVDAWLDTPFSQEDRHLRRIDVVNSHGETIDHAE